MRLIKSRAKYFELQVDAKTRDIKSILKSIQQGILTIETSHGNIGPEYSLFLEELVGTKDITNKNFYDLIFEKSNFSQDEKSQIVEVISASVGEEELSFLMNNHLLPKETFIKTDNHKKIYELDWNPILNQEIIEKILLVIRDVTDLRELEVAAKKNFQQFEIIQEIINVPIDKFDSMINSSRKFLDKNRKIINENARFDLDIVQELFRNMHTMKGLARSYQLKSLAEAARIAEAFYSHLLTRNEWQAKEMLSELDKAQEILDSYQYINDKKLGRKLAGTKNISIDYETVENNLELLTDFELYAPSDITKDKINSMRKLFIRLIRNPLKQVIDSQLTAAASIARQLGKQEPKIIFEDPGFSLGQDCHELLNNVFTHLIRNSIDHGLDPSEERVKTGKPEMGTLTFILQEVNSQLYIKYRDDGRGLNLPAIHRLAIEKNLINKDSDVNPSFVANLIFKSGFSTKKNVGDISGLGVGMDAVRNFLEDSNCQILVNLINSNERELGFAAFEFIIVLPTKYFQFIDEKN